MRLLHLACAFFYFVAAQLASLDHEKAAIKPKEQFLPAVLLTNSSLESSNLVLDERGCSAVFSVDKDSKLHLTRVTSLKPASHFHPSCVSSGQCFFVNFSVVFEAAWNRSACSLAGLSGGAGRSSVLFSSFDSLVFCPLKSSSFVCGGIGDSESVEGCIFSNVTAKEEPIKELQMADHLSAVNSSVLLNNTFFRCADVYYGTVVHGLSPSSPACDFRSSFDRFIRCTHSQSTEKSSKFHFSRTERVPMANQHGIFSNEEWIECKGQQGGAIYFDGYYITKDYDLNISNSVFEKCHSDDKGGAIFIYKIYRHKCAGCHFFGNTAVNDPQDIYVANTDSYYKIANFAFSNSYSTTTGTSFYINGQGNFSNFIANMSEQMKTKPSGVDGWGCGLGTIPCQTIAYAYSAQRTKYIMSMLCEEGTYTPPALTISEKPLTLAGTGMDKTTIGSSVANNAIFMVSGNKLVVQNLCFLLSKKNSRILRMTSASSFSSSLGHSSNEPNSFYSSNSGRSNSQFESIKINQTANSELSTSLFSIESGQFSVSRLTAVNIRLSSSFFSLFFFSSCNNPSISDCVFDNITAWYSAVASIYSPIFTQLSSSNLTLSLQNCSFNNITSKDCATGGCLAFNAKLTSLSSDSSISNIASSLSINNCSFSLCASKPANSKGGAIYANYGRSKPTETDFYVFNTSFSSNQATFGSDLYFVCFDFEESVNDQLFGFVSTAESIKGIQMSIFGDDFNYFQGDPIDLMIFLKGYFAMTVYATSESSGEDIFFCGEIRRKCSTVNYALGRLASPSSSFSNGQRTIYISGSSTVTSSGNLLSSVSILSDVGSTAKSSLSSSSSSFSSDSVKANLRIPSFVTGRSSYIFHSSGETSFNCLAFSIAPSVTDEVKHLLQSLVSLQNGILTLSDCSFQWDESYSSNFYSSSLILISSDQRADAKLVINQCTISHSASLAISAPIFDLSQGSISSQFTSLHIQNVTSSSRSSAVFAFKSSFSSSSDSSSSPSSSTANPQTSFTQCSFASIKGSEGTNALFSTSPLMTGSVAFEQCNLTDCVGASSTEGGGMRWDVCDSEEMKMINCNVSSCAAKESAGSSRGSNDENSKGKGGGVYLILNGSSSNFLFESCTFSDNRAEVGRDVFIQCEKLYQAADLSKYVDVFSSAFDVENSFFGAESSALSNTVDLLDAMRYRSTVVFVCGIAPSSSSAINFAINSDPSAPTSQTGVDWFRCGPSDDPCETIDFSLKQKAAAETEATEEEEGGEMQKIKVKECSFIKAEIDLSDSILSAAEESEECRVDFVQSIPKATGIAITNTKTMKISHVSFNVPTAFTNGMTILISSQSGTTSLESCNFYLNSSSSFAQSNDDTDSFSFPLVGVFSGVLSVVSCCFGSNSAVNFGSDLMEISDSVDFTFDTATFQNLCVHSDCLFKVVHSNEASLLHSTSVSASASASTRAQTEQTKGEGDVSGEDFSEYSFKFLNCTFNSISSITSVSSVSSAVRTGKASLLSPEHAASVVLSNCSVSTCLSEGSLEGGALRLSASSQSPFTLKKSSISSCACNTASGKGGFLFLCLDGRDAEFNFEELTFSGNEAKVGENMFLACTELNASIKTSKFNFDFSDFADNINAFVGNDTKYGNKDLALFLFAYLGSTINVGSEGLDLVGCGTRIPCHSFWTSIKHIDTEASNKRIIITSSTDVEDEHDISGLIISSQNALNPLSDSPFPSSTLSVHSKLNSLNNSQKGVLVNSRRATIEDVLISIPSSFLDGNSVSINENVLFASECDDAADLGGSGLSLTKCIFQKQIDESVKYKLVAVMKGKVSLCDVWVEEMAFSCSAFAFSSGGVLWFEECHFASVNLEPKSFIEMLEVEKPKNEREREKEGEGGSSTAVLLLNASSFSSINNGASNPCSSIFSLQNSYEVEVVGCTFQTLGSEGCKKGGAMSFELKGADGQLKMKGVGVTNSICSSSEGCGGGIYLTCATDNNDRYSFSEISVGGNKAHQGRDMFIVANDLRKGVNSELFAFATQFEEKTNALVGFDRRYFNEAIDLMIFVEGFVSASVLIEAPAGQNEVFCGSRYVPCQSLDYSVNRLAECNADVPLRVITVKSNGSIENDISLNSVNVLSFGKENSGINISTNVQFASGSVVSSTAALSFSSIDFHIPHVFVIETPEGASLFSSSTETGNIQFSSCSFILTSSESQDRASCVHLISVLGGVVQLSQCHADSASFSVTPFVISQTAQASFEGVSFAHLSFSSCSLFDLIPSTPEEKDDYSSSANQESQPVEISFKNCEFKSLHVSEYDEQPSFGFVQLETHLSIVNCSLDDLTSALSEKGGGMKIELGTEGSFCLKGENSEQISSVSHCTCSTFVGKGGFLYLSCCNSIDGFSLSDLVFSENEAFVGRNVFILSSDLNASVVIERLMFDWTEWKNTTAFFGADEVNFTEGISLDKLLFEHTDTSVVVSSSGRDIRGCGSEREPCLSFWEGMRHFREGVQFREIKINTSAAISDEWDLSNSSISPSVPSSPGYSSSSDEPSSDECTINVGKTIQSLSEPSEAVLTNKLVLTFTSINFCLPSSFETPQKELLFTETGTATLNKCSFAMQTAEEGIAFVLFHVSSGTLSIEGSKMAELSFATSAIRLAAPAAHFVASAFSVDVLNLADGSFISVGDAEEKGNEESVLSGNDKEMIASEIRLENLQWHLISSTNARTSIISYESALSVALTMDNSTFSDCNSESLLGGAFCVWMKEKAGGLAGSWANEGSLLANLSSFVTCACSTSDGRGGAIVLNCLDDPEHSDAPSAKKAKALPIKFRLIRFSLNRASVGKDLFIVCRSIAEQINEALFAMDFSELAFDRNNAIFGMDKENEGPIDLVPFIVFYKSERVFVSAEKGKNKKDCGRREDPCETLSEAVRHLNDEQYQNVLVVKKAAVSAETAISSATVQTVGGSPAVFEFKCEIAQTGGSADCVVSSSEECSILGMDIVFGPSFASPHRSVFGVRSGNLTLGDCTIRSEELAQLANTVIYVESHCLCLSNVSFSSIRLQASRQQPLAAAFGAKQSEQSSFALSLFEPEAGHSFIEACSGAAVVLDGVCFKELSLFVVSGDTSQSAHFIKCESSSLTVSGLRMEDCSVSFISPTDSVSSSSSSSSHNSFESSANSLISVSCDSVVILGDIQIERIFECCGVLSAESGCKVEVKQSNISSLSSHSSVFAAEISASVVLREVNISQVAVEEGSLFALLSLSPHLSTLFNEESDNFEFNSEFYMAVDENGETQFELISSEISNIQLKYAEGSALKAENWNSHILIDSCVFSNISRQRERGSYLDLTSCGSVAMEKSSFWGVAEMRSQNGRNIHSKVNENDEIGEETDFVCEWNSSSVNFVGSTANISNTSFENFSQGAISLSNSTVTIEMGMLQSNNPFVSGYPSLRRNILCSDGSTLNVKSVKGGDGMNNSSFWILGKHCTFRGIITEVSSPFFVPKITSAQTTKREDKMEIEFVGQLLLPCNLEIQFTFKRGEYFMLKECEKVNFVDENEISCEMDRSSYEWEDKETEVFVRILFGEEARKSTENFILKNGSKSQPKEDESINKTDEGDSKREINPNDTGSSTDKKSVIEWSLIALVGCAFVLVVFVLGFVGVVCVLRKRLKKAEKKIEEVSFENMVLMGKIEKRRGENNGGSFEMSEMPSTLLEGMTSQIPLLIDNDEDLPEPPSMTDEELNENDLPDLELPLPFSEDVSVSELHQNNSFNVISAKKPFREKEKKNLKTLHSAIHSVEGDFTLGTRAMEVVDGKEVVLAVAELFEHLISAGDERVEMMGKQLCPYSIFVEEGNGNGNEVFVLGEELEDEKQKEEMKRWQAPELWNERNEEEEDGIEQAVVFSLGLILHEMTTGEVPLSECGAEEAQEMMRDGVRPLTEGIEGEEMVELMERMWADEPNERPSLAEVIQLLMEMAES
ncbi:uncharacterized protein MONOS_1932 [Monocercomonoides exilis]|uniref:uncharacterized protein n=1 Tax=Monocercomonoides exilis TaxID=2049356 RepID=UPI00355A8A3A|nr:hypothetical protein MONOS_1932 [Monocercomonoides exilis]|eukprot:MONOS_1932.1-p1 / transcript=MONOS_1932.1 / gene=MONOS_1932 / organism=Monocercomonoides_exilis_PA203 / gene_product=unspecified product / transcript_product=unspecified product / location=Mono_scaffold00037:44893-56691(+) / protein_length=3932 / sequence_SO=supercontig / SO=protein_coding / is_pseudo=false